MIFDRAIAHAMSRPLATTTRSSATSLTSKIYICEGGTDQKEFGMSVRALLRHGAVIEPGIYHVERLCGPDPSVARANPKALIGTSTRINLPEGYVFFRIDDACPASAQNTIAMAGYSECNQRIIVLWNYQSDCCSARFGDKPAIPHQPLSA
jgi:hypothetical protein